MTSKTKWLGRIDLNQENLPMSITTHWCRIDSDPKEIHNYKDQSHSFFELHICLKGECEFDLGGVTCKLKEGTYLLLSPQRKHRLMYASDDFTKLVFGFSIAQDKISDALALGTETAWPREMPASGNAAMEILLAESEHSDSFETLTVLKYQIYSLLVFLIRDLTNLQAEEKITKNRVALMEELHRFIYENLSANVGLTEVSAWIGISSRQLERICLAEEGMSFGQIKRNIRHKKIQHLLSETDLSLSEIALSVGVADEYTMSKLFSRTEGTPPATYRRWCKTH